MPGKNVVEIEIKVEGRDAKEVLHEISHQFSRLGQGARRAGEDLTRTEKHLSQLSHTARQVQHALKMVYGALAAYAGLQVVQNLARLADQYQLLSARLRLVSDSTRQFRQAQEELYRIAQSSRTSLAATYEIYTRLANATREFGVSQQELLRVVETLNNAILVSGASAQEAEAALLQLSQAMASGRLQGDELRSVLEQMPILGRAIAKEMGVTIGQLRELGSQGQITTQVILRALNHVYDEMKARAAEIPMTVGQAFQVLENSWARLVGESKELGGLFTTLKAGALALSKTLDQIRAGELTGDFEKLGEVGGEVFIALTYGAEGLAKAFLGLKAVWQTLKLAFYKLEDVIASGLKGILDKVLSVLEAINANAVGDKLIPDSFIENLKETSRYLGEWGVAYKESVVEAKEALAETMGQIEAVGNVSKTLRQNFQDFQQELKKAGQTGVESFRKTGRAAEKAGDTIEYSTEELEQLRKIYDRITLEALPAHERALEEVRRKYEELRDLLPELVDAGIIGMEEAIRLDEMLAAREEEALQRMRESHKKTTSQIQELWQHTYEQLTDIVAGWIYNLSFSLKSVVDLFRRTAAQMVATWVMTPFSGVFGKPLEAPGAQGGAASMNFAFPGLGSLLARGKAGLTSFFGTPYELFDWLFTEQGYEWAAGPAWFFQTPLGAAVGAGLMSALTTGLFTGDWKRAGVAGLGSGLGFAVGGPVGGFLGGIAGSVLGGLFGHKKAPRVNFTVDVGVDFVPGTGFVFSDFELETERKYGAKPEYENQIRQAVENLAQKPLATLNHLVELTTDDLPDYIQAEFFKKLSDIDFETEFFQRTHKSLKGDIDTRPIQDFTKNLLYTYGFTILDAAREEEARWAEDLGDLKYVPEGLKDWFRQTEQSLFPANFITAIQNIPTEKIGTEDFDRWWQENIAPLEGQFEKWENFKDWSQEFFKEVSGTAEEIDNLISQVTKEFGSDSLSQARTELQTVALVAPKVAQGVVGSIADLSQILQGLDQVATPEQASAWLDNARQAEANAKQAFATLDATFQELTQQAEQMFGSMGGLQSKLADMLMKGEFTQEGAISTAEQYFKDNFKQFLANQMAGMLVTNLFQPLAIALSQDFWDEIQKGIKSGEIKSFDDLFGFVGKNFDKFFKDFDKKISDAFKPENLDKFFKSIQGAGDSLSEQVENAAKQIGGAGDKLSEMVREAAAELTKGGSQAAQAIADAAAKLASAIPDKITVENVTRIRPCIKTA